MRQAVVYALYGWCAISLIAVIVHQFKRRTSSSPDAGVAAAPSSSTSAVGGELIDPDGADDQARFVLNKGGKNQSGMTNTNRTEDLSSSADAPEREIKAIQKPDPDTVEVPAISTIAAEAATIAVAVPPTAVPLNESAPSAVPPMAAGTEPEPAFEPRKGLAKLLAGIALPYDLLPIIPDRPDIDENHVSLLTSSAPLDVVGPAIADELERLGYQLEPVSESELQAIRGNDSLTLEIITSPTTAEHLGRLVYPQAKNADVVITIDAG